MKKYNYRSKRNITEIVTLSITPSENQIKGTLITVFKYITNIYN